jgi:NAD+ synthase (glutamine-hydrolysing)
MNFLRLAAGQLDLSVGSINTNVDKILAAVSEAASQGAELLVLPELAITGYPPEDLLLRPGFIDENLSALQRLAASVEDEHLALVVGFVDREQDLYNAAAVIARGQIQFVYHKQILPNYMVFDELRYFTPGQARSQIFELNSVRVAIAICEDAWSPSGAIHQAGMDGADLVVVLNASPYEAGRQFAREQLMKVRAQDASCAVFYVNLVGGQDELVFDGGSFLVDEHGELVGRAPRFEESTWCTTLPVRGDRYRKRLLDPRGISKGSPPSEPSFKLSTGTCPSQVVIQQSHVIEPISTGFDPVEAYQAVVLGTRDYLLKNGFPGALVAVSGGIDSALVAVIAADAIGAQRLELVALPSRYSSASSLADARQLANNLGVNLRVIEIEPAHSALLKMLPDEVACQNLVEENLQSRIRGLIMMALSNGTGKVVLTTGNKSELAVGYSTLYGDTAGGFAVIKDLYKTQVYTVANWLNAARNSEVIPLSIIDKAPSAELRPGQLDTDSLPPYEVLDPLLTLLIDDDMTAAEVKQLGFDSELVDRIAVLIDRSEYKRRQSPIGVRLSHKAFGKDRRVPITTGKLA